MKSLRDNITNSVCESFLRKRHRTDEFTPSSSNRWEDQWDPAALGLVAPIFRDRVRPAQLQHAGQ